MPSKRASQAGEMAVVAALASLPASVRDELIDDPTFTARLNLATNRQLALSALTLTADSVYQALRAAVAGAATAMVDQVDGPAIEAKLAHRKTGEASLAIGSQVFVFADAGLLAKARPHRLRALKQAFTARPLMATEEDRWQSVARQRPFSNDEFFELTSALEHTPEALHAELATRSRFDLDDLIPKDSRYWQRVVSPLGDAAAIGDLVNGELHASRSELLRRHPRAALRRIAHSAQWRPLIPFDLLDRLDVQRLRPLLKSEDPFSLLFGFELCVRRLADEPAALALGTRFLRRLLVEKASRARCAVFSAFALITCVHVQKGVRTAGAPVFWTRLLALTQAAVLTDAVRRTVDAERFWQWSLENFHSDYLWYGTADRWEAPRWRPDWIEPRHVYAELTGRVLVALATLPEDQRPTEWMQLLARVIAELKKAGDLLATQFAGPLDDFGTTPVSSEHPHFQEVEEPYDSAVAIDSPAALLTIGYTTLASPRLIANLTRILQQPPEQPVAARAATLAALHGCAHVAATTRSETLAKATIERVVREAARPGRTEPIYEALLVLLLACAACRDRAGYEALLGETMVRLCFSVSAPQDVGAIASVIRILTARDARLFPVLSRARAIVRSKSSP